MRKGVVLVLAVAAAVSARAQDRGRSGDVESNGAQRNPRQAEQRSDGGRRAGPQASGGQAVASDEAAGGTSDLFERACVDLLHGNTPQGEKAIEALKDACANLMSSKAEARIQTEQRRQARQ